MVGVNNNEKTLKSKSKKKMLGRPKSAIDMMEDNKQKKRRKNLSLLDTNYIYKEDSAIKNAKARASKKNIL